jgi:hypothetical protein
MTYNPLAIKRRDILGDLYDRCEPISSIPVYLNDTAGEPIGVVDESLGTYVDAFLFNLPEDVCKKLSTNGSYDIAFDYDFSDKKNKSTTARVKLNHILLVTRQLSLPIPRKKVALAS